MSILLKKKNGLHNPGFIKSWVKDLNSLDFVYALQDSKIFKVDLKKMLSLKPSLDDQVYQAEIIFENRTFGIDHFMFLPGSNSNRLMIQNKSTFLIYDISIQNYLIRLRY